MYIRNKGFVIMLSHSYIAPHHNHGVWFKMCKMQNLYVLCFITQIFFFPHRLTPDQKYLVVAQLNTNRVTLLEAPPVGIIGQCKVVSSIQLADDIKPHLVELDQKTGALYVAEIGAQQAHKFVPITIGSFKAETWEGTWHHFIF